MNQPNSKLLTSEILEELFVSDDKCLELLAKVKWADGFTCRKCGNTNSCPGKIPHSRRCTRCKNEESATSNTLFHNCKFETSKAFFIAHHIIDGGNTMSTLELANKLGLRESTCWKFKSKIQQILNGILLLNEGQKTTLEDVLIGRDKFKEQFNSFF